MADQVLPYVPDAWVDHTKTKLGYEIALTRHFYKCVPPRPLIEIDAEIKVWVPRTRRPSSGDHPVLVDEPAQPIGSSNPGEVDVADKRRSRIERRR